MLVLVSILLGWDPDEFEVLHNLGDKGCLLITDFQRMILKPAHITMHCPNPACLVPWSTYTLHA